MNEFQHPIAFAIDVNVKDEQNLTRLNGEAANGMGIGEWWRVITGFSGKDEDSKRINPELNQMMRGADDIDRGKLEERETF